MDSELDVNETLRECCALGNEEEVLKQLRNGAAINSQNRVNGWTPLHWATRREHASIVNILLENGADVNVRNNKCEKPVDITTNKDIKTILETAEKKANSQEKTHNNINATSPKSKTKLLTETPVNFVPGYIANPVFPYTLATANPMLRSTQTNNRGSDMKDQPMILPGYLANPVYAVAAGSPLMAENHSVTSQSSNNNVNFVPGYLANPVYAIAATENHTSAEEATSQSKTSNNETPLNFVPGYLANPVYAVGAPALANNEVREEFKPIFVPHVEQFGSLVNTYVNSMQSLEKHVEYRMCDSCHTTPVANVYVGANVSEIVLKVRQADQEDDDFVEVELNRKILTYDELLDVCSKEFRINRSDIKKIRKLPNTLIRRDKDVKRLQPYQELEIILS